MTHQRNNTKLDNPLSDGDEWLTTRLSQWWWQVTHRPTLTVMTHDSCIDCVTCLAAGAAGEGILGLDHTLHFIEIVLELNQRNAQDHRSVLTKISCDQPEISWVPSLPCPMQTMTPVFPGQCPRCFIGNPIMFCLLWWPVAVGTLTCYFWYHVVLSTGDCRLYLCYDERRDIPSNIASATGCAQNSFAFCCSSYQKKVLQILKLIVLKWPSLENWKTLWPITQLWTQHFKNCIILIFVCIVLVVIGGPLCIN